MGKKYILRLDDASFYQNSINWERIENLLTKYKIKPLVGLIPNNEDIELRQYGYDSSFLEKIKRWKNKGWMFALHGYNHVYITKEAGINPIEERSEFAGVPYDIQKDKILSGLAVLKEWDITPNVFFAPSHTFDRNTINVLNNETSIRVISDTIAHNYYYKNGIYFVPVQSHIVRSLPFKLTTYCYHPNTMTSNDFDILESFLSKEKDKFISFNEIPLSKRRRSLLDKFYQFLYFKIKRKIEKKR